MAKDQATQVKSNADGTCPQNPSKVVLCLPILQSPVGARMKIF